MPSKFNDRARVCVFDLLGSKVVKVDVGPSYFLRPRRALHVTLLSRERDTPVASFSWSETLSRNCSITTWGIDNISCQISGLSVFAFNNISKRYNP